MVVSRSIRQLPVRQLPRTFQSQALAYRYASSYTPSHRLGDSQSGTLSFFGRPRLPANKIIMFVPQQEAWVGLVKFVGTDDRLLREWESILLL
jgi:hypothetical protein